MAEHRNRYREKKEPKKSEYRKAYTRTSVHECQRQMMQMLCLLRCALVSAGVPEYRHARSNHIYSYTQKIALLVLKEYMNLSYRDMSMELGGNPIITEVLGLDFMPHHSTMAKFSKSVDKNDLKRTIMEFQVLADGGLAAVDGTCLSDRGRSAHFERRMRDFGQKTPQKVFTKASIVVDTEKKIVYAADSFAGKRHDVKFMSEMVRQLEGCRISALVADKGYDSEQVHKLVRKKLKIRLLAPARGDPTVPAKHITGHFRRKMRMYLGPMCTEFTRAYRMRCIVETVNSMIKKVFGSILRSKTPECRETEMLTRIIAHNIRQTMIISEAWVLMA